MINTLYRVEHGAFLVYYYTDLQGHAAVSSTASSMEIADSPDFTQCFLSPTLRNQANQAPIGTDPFKFQEYERGQYIIGVRNEDYWRGPEYPYLDRIIWRFIPDKAAGAAALEAGEIHESGFNGISMADLERLGSDPRFDMGTAGVENNVAHSTVEFNLRNPILADLRVRQAVYHGLDLDFAINTIMRGFAKPGRGPIPSIDDTNYTDDVPIYEYDIEKAKALLDEAGYQSDEMDQLIDDAAAELDPAKRAELYYQVQRLAMTDLPVIFAIEHPFIGITNKKLVNHHNTPRWDSSSWYDLWIDE